MATRTDRRGRVWRETLVAVNGWDSDCGNFRIIPSKRSGFILIAFEHEPTEDDGFEFWTRVFPTVEAAMEYAERM